MATTVFDNIYRNNEWGCGSGNGSTVTYTAAYREFLEQWLRQQHVTTVLDIGCGDWQSTKLINWEGIDYTGIDCVPSLITEHQKNYQAPNLHFYVKDVLSQPLTQTYDVIILKDVIQHWPTSEIRRVLPQLQAKAKWLLLTNCRHQRSATQDTELGGFRPLHYQLSPLQEFAPTLLFSWNEKDVVLVRGLA